jgi:hypothetical protein
LQIGRAQERWLDGRRNGTLGRTGEAGEARSVLSQLVEFFAAPASSFEWEFAPHAERWGPATWDQVILFQPAARACSSCSLSSVSCLTAG